MELRHEKPHVTRYAAVRYTPSHDAKQRHQCSHFLRAVLHRKYLVLAPQVKGLRRNGDGSYSVHINSYRGYYLFALSDSQTTLLIIRRFAAAPLAISLRLL